jgi:uncharacterized protein with NAD-binding domain and iron-sulfur cluster
MHHDYVREDTTTRNEAQRIEAFEESMTSSVFCDVTGTIKGDGTTVTFASRHTYRDVRYDVKQENACVIDRY